MSQQIGETRQALTEDLLSKKLHDVSKQAHDRGLDEFWILIAHKPDIYLWNIIRESITVLNKRPPKMLGSMCFHVIWSRGLLEPEWILPVDRGDDLPDIIGTEGNSDLIYNSVKDLSPILS